MSGGKDGGDPNKESGEELTKRTSGFPTAETRQLKDYLMDVVGIPKDLLTPKCIDMLLRNRARNQLRGRYTIGGYVIEEFKDLDPLNTLGLFRTLFDQYRTPVKEMVGDLDIFQLPAFALMTDELTEILLECCDVAGEMVGVDLDESTASVDDEAERKLTEAAKAVFIDCSHERDGIYSLDVEDFFMCVKSLKVDRNISLDMNYDETANMEAPQNREVLILFQSIVGDAAPQLIGLDEWNGFVHTQHLYANWASKDPPVEFTMLDNKEWLLVFNIYWFYSMIVISQMVLPVILMMDWSTGALGEVGEEFEFRQILLDPNRSAWTSLCTNEATFSFKFAVACVFSFLILLTDVGNAVINMERRTWGTPVQWTAIENDEEEASTSPYQIMKHSPMAADPVFFELGDFWNLTCYCLIVVATYVLMQASGSLDNVLKDIIAVNFLVELDNLVCQVVITDTHLEYFEAKLMLSYIMYGERTSEEVLLETAGGEGVIMQIRNGFKIMIDYFFAPILLVIYYFMYTTPILTFVCY